MTARQRAEEMAAAIDEAVSNDAAEEDRPYARVAPPRTPNQVYSIRIPVDRLDQLRSMAAERGLQPTALIRRWVLERLDQESGPAPVGPVMVVHATSRSAVGELKDGLRRAEEQIASALATNNIFSPVRNER
jgi:hypothetical protein